ncbi:MAG TPA: hypothetical protein VM529_23180 [Gemmata sp.]|jgi:hypothetical protein|nr:hypothetical protein [Gemmata sp.]
MLRLTLPAAGLLLAALAGCSGPANFAPVSGVVTLDGKPYPNAVVSFQPLGTPDNPNPGRGSSAYTDENGRFVLKGEKDADGALIGKHRVRIMTRGNDVVGQDSETGSSDETPAGARKVDPIPPEWNALSQVEFDVPKGGTDKADFNIVAKKAKK